MKEQAIGDTRTVLHERLCLREHRDLRLGILAIALVQILFTIISYVRRGSPGPLSTFEMAALSVGFVVCLLLALTLPCFEERSILALVATSMVLDLSARFVTRQDSGLLSIQHRRVADILIWIGILVLVIFSSRRRDTARR